MPYLICETEDVATSLRDEIEANWRAANTESYCSQWKSYCDVQGWENDERCTIYCGSSKYFPSDTENRAGVTVADSVPSDLLNQSE